MGVQVQRRRERRISIRSRKGVLAEEEVRGIGTTQRLRLGRGATFGRAAVSWRERHWRVMTMAHIYALCCWYMGLWGHGILVLSAIAQISRIFSPPVSQPSRVSWAPWQ
jgi:hypothetical protein